MSIVILWQITINLESGINLYIKRNGNGNSSSYNINYRFGVQWQDQEKQMSLTKSFNLALRFIVKLSTNGYSTLRREHETHDFLINKSRNGDVSTTTAIQLCHTGRSLSTDEFTNLVTVKYHQWQLHLKALCHCNVCTLLMRLSVFISSVLITSVLFTVWNISFKEVFKWFCLC